MLAPSQEVQDLIRARDYLADEEHWCQHILHDEDRSCALGALWRCHRGDTHSGNRAAAYLEQAAAELFPELNNGIYLTAANVNDERGHAAVMLVYDRAIELASLRVSEPA